MPLVVLASNRIPNPDRGNAELRRAREALGVTQRQVADAVHYSESKVGAVERGEQLPSPSFAQLADEFLKTDGPFARMRSKLLTVEVMPQWFRPWVDYEREAVEIRWCEPLLVPGLLQTEEYARALLEEGSPRQAEQLLAARLERQQMLGQAERITIIDESVLRREIGNPEVMYGQLRHLTPVPAPARTAAPAPNAPAVRSPRRVVSGC